MIRQCMRYLFAMLAVLVAVSAQAAPAPTRVDADFSHASVVPQVELLEDPGGELEFDAVRTSSAFEPAPAIGTNFGFTRSAWWVRFALVNPDEDDHHVLLREDYPLIDYFDIWAPDGQGGWRHVSTGDRTPFASREFEHRDFIFELDVPARSERTIYLRAQSSGPLDLNLSLSGTHALISQLSTEQVAYGVYYGGFLVLVLYNFFIFLVVRDRAFVYYLLYAASYGLYFAIHNGLAFQFLWPRSPYWGNQALLVMLSLTLFFGMQFARTFLDSAGFARRLDRIAVATQMLAAVGLLASFFASYAVLILPISILTVVVVALILILGTLGLVKGYKPARFFMIAWGMLLVGVLAYMLKVFGILPHNLFTQNAFQVGSLVEMVLLSLALASRVRDLQRQSRTDTLTGIPNRRHFDEVAAAEFDRSRRNSTPLSLLMVDIDHFKRFNDLHGHARGDEILRQVAEQLYNGVRRSDHVCRYGGEEFAVILPATASDEAGRIAESLRSTIESHVPDNVEVSISVGLAGTNDAEFASLDALFHAADRALYRAKSQGRNRVTRHSN